MKKTSKVFKLWDWSKVKNIKYLNFVPKNHDFTRCIFLFLGTFQVRLCLYQFNSCFLDMLIFLLASTGLLPSVTPFTLYANEPFPLASRSDGDRRSVTLRHSSGRSLLGCGWELAKSSRHTCWQLLKFQLRRCTSSNIASLRIKLHKVSKYLTFIDMTCIPVLQKPNVECEGEQTLQRGL